MKIYRCLNDEVKAVRFFPADWEKHDTGPYCEGYVTVNQSQEYGEPGRWFTSERIPSMIMPGDWVIIRSDGKEFVDIASHETFLVEYEEIKDNLFNRISKWVRELI